MLAWRWMGARELIRLTRDKGFKRLALNGGVLCLYLAGGFASRAYIKFSRSLCGVKYWLCSVFNEGVRVVFSLLRACFSWRWRRRECCLADRRRKGLCFLTVVVKLCRYVYIYIYVYLYFYVRIHICSLEYVRVCLSLGEIYMYVYICSLK